MRSTSMFTVVLALSTPALAKTPDGVTPSVETVCDQYGGAAYGLCNAYCEAMDCDHPNVRASPKACAQVASRFEKFTGEKLVCDPGDDEGACSVTAVDDFYVVEQIPDEGVLLDVTANDERSDGAVLTITSTSADDFLVEIDASGEDLLLFGYPGDFTYEVCCDEATCSQATVGLES